MTLRESPKRFSLFGAAVGVVLLLAAPALHATTVTVVNLDGAGEGFNDPTARGPEGGNPGITLGDLRLNAFQEAANRWAAVVDSSVVISAEGNFDPMFCNPGSAILGGAGPITVDRDFPNAPVGNTWYAQATANSIAGSDRNLFQNDLGAAFNSNIDNGCLTGVSSWYYGYDGNPGPNQIDFIPTLLHEFAHGLGFTDFVDLDTGAKLAGRDDTFMLNLEDHSTGKLYPNMSNAERVAASINTGNLHWVGTNVMAQSSLLSAGKTGDHVHMYAPNPNEPGSSVAHFDTSLTPDELMEPFDTPTNIQVLTEALFEDIGWTLLPPGPTATPTSTATPTATPTLTPTVAPPPACAPAPVGGCVTPGKSIFVLKDKTVSGPDPDKADKIIWKWLRGPATTFPQLGDPINNLSSYSLCVYDRSAGTPSLAMSAGTEADGTCNNSRPCWKRLGSAANPKGYRYLDKDLDHPLAAPLGILKIVLKAGDAGKSKVSIVGKGANLNVPGPAGANYFNQDASVTVQLIKTDGGLCWEANYPAGAVRNQADLFKDKCGVGSEPACS